MPYEHPGSKAWLVKVAEIMECDLLSIIQDNKTHTTYIRIASGKHTIKDAREMLDAIIVHHVPMCIRIVSIFDGD
jgi:hypothetical protein